ncbi:terminase family protein [Brevibacillus sp. MER 51]|uniref:terminase large subunit domain-containing protein n=1 Tax=Brevibacillus sp. MER 51 TaxID=2939560 RepID=UPI00203DAACC|nr:terminase family protein [Brevibacillus sp. MER 51]
MTSLELDLDPFADWTPHEKQIEVMECDARNVVMNCGRRGGKTNVGARKFFDKVLSDIEADKGLPYKPPRNLKVMKKPKPRLEYWCVSPTYSMSEIQQEELGAVIPEEMIESWDLSKNRVWLKGYILIQFKSADNPKTLVGKGLDGVWLDEASKMKEQTWSGYLSYALADKGGWSVWTTTPEGMNWFYHDIVLNGQHTQAGGQLDEYRNDPEWCNFYWTSKDNPLPELQKNIQRMIETMPKRYVDREIFARFDVFFGQVYEEFNRSIHVVPRALCEQKFKDGHFVHIEAGKDWGFTNPGVTLVGAMTANGELWIVDAIYKAQMEILVPGDSNCWVAQDKELMKKWKIKMFWCDSEDASNIKTYLTNGLPAKAAQKHLKEGIRAVSTLFKVKSDNGRPNIFISDHLKEVIQELTNYRYPEDVTGDRAEVPVKENDHSMDGLRYLVWNSKVFHQLLISRFKVIPWKIAESK